MSLLQATQITKSYAGIQALKGVSFTLNAGEVHALVGENGAGKSTLIKVITGATRADSGTLQVGGADISEHSPALAKSLGIAAIYQHPALLPELSVMENIALTSESRGLWRRVNWKQRRAHAQDLLDRLGAQMDPETPVHQLTMPEQQLVEIARALGAQARVLILDEPTASLSHREVETLFTVMRGLREQGVGMIYISHRLEELPAIADRVTVLRDGHSIATHAMAEVDRPMLIRLMVGRELSAVFPKRDVPIGEVAFEIRQLSSSAAGVRDVSLTVRRGEILGLAGLVGSGRTPLAETIFGLHAADSGEILVRGEKVRIGSPADAIRHGLAYVPEDRPKHGLIMPLSIAVNTSLANLPAVSRHGFLDEPREVGLAVEFIRRFGTKTPSPFLPVNALSGGNQQKVLLSRWLATNPSVLILDEPTQGVDVGAKAEIHRLIVDLAERGLAILMISSELPEVLGMADRIAVMHAGSLAGILDRSEATQQLVLELALGEKNTTAGGRIAS